MFGSAFLYRLGYRLIEMIPAAVFIFFVVSLAEFCMARNANKENPEAHSKEQMTAKKMRLIISSVLLALLVAAFLVFMVVVFMSIPYM